MTQDQRFFVNSVKSQIVNMTEEQLLEIRELMELDLERLTPAERKEIAEAR